MQQPQLVLLTTTAVPVLLTPARGTTSQLLSPGLQTKTEPSLFSKIKFPNKSNNVFGQQRKSKKNDTLFNLTKVKTQWCYLTSVCWYKIFEKMNNSRGWPCFLVISLKRPLYLDHTCGGFLSFKGQGGPVWKSAVPMVPPEPSSNLWQTGTNGHIYDYNHPSTQNCLVHQETSWQRAERSVVSVTVSCLGSEVAAESIWDRPTGITPHSCGFHSLRSRSNPQKTRTGLR